MPLERRYLPLFHQHEWKSGGETEVHCIRLAGVSLVQNVRQTFGCAHNGSKKIYSERWNLMEGKATLRQILNLVKVGSDFTYCICDITINTKI